MRFGRRQIGKAHGNAGKEAELFDGVADTGVGVGDPGDDVVELGVLFRRKMEVVGGPLAADVSDLGGSAFDLAVYEFEEQE